MSSDETTKKEKKEFFVTKLKKKYAVNQEAYILKQHTEETNKNVQC